MTTPTKVFLFVLLFLIGVTKVSAQNFKAYFRDKIIRVNSSSKKVVDTTLQVVIPKGQSLVNGKLIIKPSKGLSSIDLKKLKVPLSNEYKIGALEDTMNVTYDISFPRDIVDDKTISFEIKVYDSTGKIVALSDVDTTTLVYVKPLISDSLTTNSSWESWFMTGTNFDPFDGVKPQEFFFRANTILKIRKNFYGQIAFYKNRYFSSDSTSNNTISQPNSPTQIINGTDTTYSYLRGTYQTNTTQKIDPVGVQLDFLYKLTKDEIKGNSNYFLSFGFDVSTKYITIEQKFSNIDTATFISKTLIPRSSILGVPKSNISYSYQKPVSNFNLGIMWILDTDDANIKAQLNTGISNFWEPTLILNPRGGGATITYYSIFSKPYFQVRMFTTSKKYGVSLGFESFVRKLEYPQFNFTLSKVFDLKNFLAILTPVSSFSANK